MREAEFMAWDGLRMTTSGIQFSSTTGLLTMVQNMPLIQYTGRKDKNGKKIHEGDIFGVYCLVGDFEGKYEPLGKVIYDNDMAAFCIEKSNGGWQYLFEFLLEYKKAEIIGNIYENPELLK